MFKYNGIFPPSFDWYVKIKKINKSCWDYFSTVFDVKLYLNLRTKEKVTAQVTSHSDLDNETVIHSVELSMLLWGL